MSNAFAVPDYGKRMDMKRRERYYRRKASGLCVHCGQPRETEKVECRACVDKIKTYIENNREKYLATKRGNRLRLRLEVYDAYGGPKCATCGIDLLDVLSMDHVEGGGNQHRKLLGSGGDKIYRWLKRSGYPPGFRVLCMNCQFLTRVGKDPNILRDRMVQLLHPVPGHCDLVTPPA